MCAQKLDLSSVICSSPMTKVCLDGHIRKGAASGLAGKVLLTVLATAQCRR